MALSTQLYSKVTVQFLIDVTADKQKHYNPKCVKW